MPFQKKHKKREENIFAKNTIEKRCFITKPLKNDYIYDGNCKNGLRHGFGTIRKLESTGFYSRIYAGNWNHNEKHGEGRQFYKNGIYFGQWQNGKRHGNGIMWYNNGVFYLGEWKYDCYNGAGVLFQENRNRYEGFFKDDQKHGEGTFYHIHSGQIQKGMWQKGQCVTSIMQDEIRPTGTRPTEYPIERNNLCKVNKVIHDSFRPYMTNIKDLCSCRSFEVIITFCVQIL